MKYRAEIDGLRTIAVVPVVLFHAGLTVFSGGFVGVDIFFVISGYLITSILMRELEEKRFSIVKFYERRFRRILPALYVVIATTFIASFFFLNPSEFEDFAQSVIACMTFMSNVLFSLESGYFDINAENKPLLHTWSLAVEEQYYLFFPLLFAGLAHIRKKFVEIGITGLAIASFVLCIFGAQYAPDYNFYLLPSRTWELLAGSICALVAARLPNNQFLALLGVVLLALSIFFIDATMSFPGWVTLGPVLGSALIILFAGSGTWVAKALSFKPLVWIGLISYSLYLWHHPVLAFSRLYFGEHLSPQIAAGAILLSFVLAILTWKFVEQPMRGKNARLKGKPALFGASAAGMVFFSVLSGVVLLDNGRLGRVPEFYKALEASASDASNVYAAPGKELVIGNQTHVVAALIGDSHANSLVQALGTDLAGTGNGMLIFTRNGCPPIRGLMRFDFGPRLPSPCDAHARRVFDRILSDPNIETVFVATRMPLYLEGSRFDNGEGGIETGVSDEVIFDTIENAGHLRAHDLRKEAIANAFTTDMAAFGAAGKKVVLIYPIPEVGWNILNYAWRHRSDEDIQISTSAKRYDERSASTIALYDQITAEPWAEGVEPRAFFCDTMIEDRCIATMGRTSFYRDNNHLNNTGAAKISPRILSALGSEISTN